MRAIVACVGLVVAAPIAAAQPGAAPTVRLRVDGACPDAAAITAALGARATVVDGAAPATVAIEVSAGVDGVAVTLAADPRVEHRLVPGHDCAALAGAVAALADAWLLELTVAPASAIAAADLAAADLAPPTPPSAVAPAPRASDAPRWFIGAGRAYVVTTAPEHTAATRVDAAWRSPWRAARLRLSFDWGDAASQPTTTGVSVERQPWTVAGTIGWRRPGRAWIEGGAGGGLVVSRVDAMGVGAMRVHPVALARLSGGLGLGLGVSVRAEVEAALYPVADQYWVGGLAAGQSPIASVAAGLGVDIALGAK